MAGFFVFSKSSPDAVGYPDPDQTGNKPQRQAALSPHHTPTAVIQSIPEGDREGSSSRGFCCGKRHAIPASVILAYGCRDNHFFFLSSGLFLSLSLTKREEPKMKRLPALPAIPEAQKGRRGGLSPAHGGEAAAGEPGPGPG